VISLWASWCAGSLRTTEELNALAQSAKGNEAAAFYSISFDEALGAAQKVCDQNSWLSLTHLHVGTSAADLILGGRMIPRIILMNKEGKVAFIGHPSKVNLQAAVATLIKGDVLELPAEALNEDDFSADVSIVPGVFGIYKADVSLAQIKEEMNEFTKLIAQFAQDNKSTLRLLETDHIITHRQTKLVEG
jgi:thiol-disulfide isomerase/thioredoxin